MTGPTADDQRYTTRLRSSRHDEVGHLPGAPSRRNSPQEKVNCCLSLSAALLAAVVPGVSDLLRFSRYVLA
jgi:hypothetical protein